MIDPLKCLMTGSFLEMSPSRVYAECFKHLGKWRWERIFVREM